MRGSISAQERIAWSLVRKTQRWQSVRATQPRQARNHTRIPARSLPGARRRCRSKIQRRSSKVSSNVYQRVARLRAHKETRVHQPPQVSNQSSDGLLIRTTGQLHARSPHVARNVMTRISLRLETSVTFPLHVLHVILWEPMAA